MASVLRGAGVACRRSIAKGALGQKTGAGIYTQGAARTSSCSTSRRSDYRPPAQETDAEVGDDPQGSRIRPRSSPKLRASEHPQAQFLWAIFRDLFHYSAFHLGDIADTARDVDFAIRWGYGWSLGSVRDLAGRGLAAGRRMDRRGHRRRQGDEQGAAARRG